MCVKFVSAQQALGTTFPPTAQVRMAFATINPSDCNVCEGTYLLQPKSLPAVVGMEASGVIIALGPNCKDFAVGDHVVPDAGMSFNGNWCSTNYVMCSNLRKVPKSLDLLQVTDTETALYWMGTAHTHTDTHMALL